MEKIVRIDFAVNTELNDAAIKSALKEYLRGFSERFDNIVVEEIHLVTVENVDEDDF